jgi:MFS family permease
MTRAPGAPPGASGWGARLRDGGLGAFRHRNFRLFYAGQAVSLVGTWMQQVAQGWLVLELTGDALALGVVAAAQFLPVLVFGLFGGVAADALPKRAGLLATQVASMVLALILGLLVLSGHVEVWQVIVLALLLGVVNSFDMPIRQAFAIEMVGRADVASAVGFNSALFNGARIVGPAAAGILIGAVGLAPCFLLNALSYLAVIAGLLAMRTSELHAVHRPDRPHSARQVVDQLVEGLRYVRGTPVILLTVGLVGVVSTLALNIQVTLPLAARDLIGGGAEAFGFLAAASGVGSLIAALSLAFGQRPTLRLMLTGAATVGASIALLGLSHSLPISLLLMVGAGWGLIAMAATTNTMIQLTVPDELRGRVMSVYTTIFAGSSPVGGLFAGVLAATFGVAVALIVGGVLAVIAVLVATWLALRSGAVTLSATMVGDPGPVAPTARR